MVVGLRRLGGRRAWRREPADSPRLARAKDLISEEQWTAAIPELRAAVADAKEQNKDEALFWLAHSQNQAGDLAEAVESIRKLQADYPKSRWKRPAGSLMIELAQKLGRRDVLWRTAVPPTPPVRPHRVRAAPRSPRAATAVRRRRRAPPSARAAASAPTPPAPPPPPPAAAIWFAGAYLPDADLRVQALGRLIHTDAPKVIPILRNIALEADNPGAARGAVFVLAQSRNPQAQSMVVDVAKVAVRKRSAWRRCASWPLRRSGRRPELLEVYSTRQRAGEAAGGRLARRARRRLVAAPDRPDRERRPSCASGDPHARPGRRPRAAARAVLARADARRAVRSSAGCSSRATTTA